MRRMVNFWCTAAAALLLWTAQAPAVDGDWRKGLKAFRVCTSCHTFEADEHRFGPSLLGVYGRAAGMAAGYDYSPAMIRARDKGLRWTRESLDKFLMDPGRFIDGGRMRLPLLIDAVKRANVIAYLKRRASGEK